MRKFYPEILMAMLLCLTAVLICARPSALPQSVPEPVLASAPAAPISVLSDEGITLQLLLDGEIQEITLHDYLIGVLLSEMPMDFAPEALKAQAVASRTYALHCSKHEAADVCADSGCCQAWQNATSDAQYYQKAKEAVEATDGLVLKYAGNLIDATFFSCSGGITESAVAVWGCEVPYLQSIESPGEEKAACYHSQSEYTPEEFANRIAAVLPNANLACSPQQWLGRVDRTSGDGVAQAEIGGVVLSGTQLRQIFGLRSTRFTLTYENGVFSFDVYGYGHRVGMSQYGAQAMAQSGAQYDEILETYYTGIEICTV